MFDAMLSYISSGVHLCRESILSILSRDGCNVIEWIRAGSPDMTIRMCTFTKKKAISNASKRLARDICAVFGETRRRPVILG